MGAGVVLRTNLFDARACAYPPDAQPDQQTPESIDSNGGLLVWPKSIPGESYVATPKTLRQRWGCRLRSTHHDAARRLPSNSCFGN